MRLGALQNSKKPEKSRFSGYFCPGAGLSGIIFWSLSSDALDRMRALA
jgi:hypothetical protein